MSIEVHDQLHGFCTPDDSECMILHEIPELARPHRRDLERKLIGGAFGLLGTTLGSTSLGLGAHL